MIVYCDQHDIPLTAHGCWGCGHSGPIEDPAADSWERWVWERMFQVNDLPIPLRFPLAR